MESQYKGTAQIIFYNQAMRARPIPFGEGEKQEVIYPEINEDGFSVYTGPKDFARLMITCHPDRFRLWRTKTLDAQRTNVANGATEWIKLYPWDYKKHLVKRIDPDNDEEILVPRFDWFEDRTGISIPRKDKPKVEEKPATTPPSSQKGVLDDLRDKAEKAGKLEKVEEYVLDFRVKIDKPKGMFSTDEFPELVKGIEKIIEE